MTTPDTQPLTSSPPRPRPRPEAVIHRVQGTGEPTSSPGPLSFGGDEVGEPSAGRPHDVVPDTGTSTDEVRTCHVCGCTDNNACQSFLTGPCWWVDYTLCSACR